MEEAYLVARPMTPCQSVIVDPSSARGCNMCAEVRRSDVLIPNPEKDNPPIVLSPHEWRTES